MVLTNFLAFYLISLDEYSIYLSNLEILYLFNSVSFRPYILIAKILIVCVFAIGIRGTVPRYRLDQLTQLN